MRKLISTMMLGVLVVGCGFAIPGCSEETATKTQTTTTTPNGKTVETQTNSIKQSGDQPPPPKTP